MRGGKIGATGSFFWGYGGCSTTASRHLKNCGNFYNVYPKNLLRLFLTSEVIFIS